MDKQTVVEKISLINEDIKAITKFIDEFFVYDDCNCDGCSRKRNGVKLKSLFKTVKTIDILNRNKENLSEDISDLFTFINNISLKLKQTKKNNKTMLKNIDVFDECDLWICKICGTCVNDKENEGNICSTCYVTFYDKCTKCGVHIIKSKDNAYNGGRFFCSKCVKTLEKCIDCNNLYEKKEMNEKSQFINSRGEFIHETKYICEYCKNSYITCHQCGISMHESASFCYGDNRYCGDCIADKQHLFAYNYRPAANKFCIDKRKTKNKDTNLLYYGCEIELESNYDGVDRNNIIKAVSDIFGDNLVYGKEDGSLTHGFEFVTHPFAWDWFMANKYKFNQLFSMSKLYGLKAMSTCGVHVHMSKNAFTSCHLYKFMYFINENKHRNFMTKVAKRDITGHRFCAAVEGKKPLMALVNKNKEFSIGKYSAVNLHPPQTAEVRIFQGTDKPRVFFAYLEFLNSLYKFTKDISIKEVGVDNFVLYLDKNKNQNVNILKLITKGG